MGTDGCISNGLYWFYHMKKLVLIKLKFKLPLGSKLLFCIDNEVILKIDSILHYRLEQDTYNLYGYVLCS